MIHLAAITFACMLAVAAQADQNQVFQDANTFAGSKNQGTFSGISSGAVSDKIPGYGTNPTETQFFQGGQGALSGPGVTKMQSCANYVPGQDRIANQECEAVNFLAQNPNVRPQFSIGNNDAMIVGARNIRNNAEETFQSLGLGSSAENESQCTTRTESTPAQYTTETCTSVRALESQQCTIGRVVNIDADANFQCDKTLTAFTSATRQPEVSASSCTYGRQVNIDEDSRFQCNQTTVAYENVTCDNTLLVNVTPGTAITNPVSAGSTLGSACSPNCAFGNVYVYATGSVNSIQVRYVDECKKIIGSWDTYHSFYLATLTLPGTGTAVETTLGLSYCGGFFQGSVKMTCPTPGEIMNCTVTFHESNPGWKRVFTGISTVAITASPPIVSAARNNACTLFNERSQ